MTPYRGFTSELLRVLDRARELPLGGLASPAKPEVPATAPVVLIFSPHPDDECIIGALPLRLLRESRWRVINVAVTLGSKPERKAARWAELQAACGYLGFELMATAPSGLERINPDARLSQPKAWAESVEIVAGILRRTQPAVVCFPHEADWNTTHVGTHYLVMGALKAMPQEFGCRLVETEFWGAMAAPNLMVEISDVDLGDLISALTFHVGEVTRNPYHLFLPAWMMDNVRRAELVGGQGSAAPDFRFATIYRLRHWAQGRATPALPGGKFLAKTEPPETLFV